MSQAHDSMHELQEYEMKADQRNPISKLVHPIDASKTDEARTNLAEGDASVEKLRQAIANAKSAQAGASS
jgi:hypothetical protein